MNVHFVSQLRSLCDHLRPLVPTFDYNQRFQHYWNHKRLSMADSLHNSLCATADWGSQIDHSFGHTCYNKWPEDIISMVINIQLWHLCPQTHVVSLWQYLFVTNNVLELVIIYTYSIYVPHPFPLYFFSKLENLLHSVFCSTNFPASQMWIIISMLLYCITHMLWFVLFKYQCNVLFLYLM